MIDGRAPDVGARVTRASQDPHLSAESARRNKNYCRGNMTDLL